MRTGRTPARHERSRRAALDAGRAVRYASSCRGAFPDTSGVARREARMDGSKQGPLVLRWQDVVLRDTLDEDVEDYVRWYLQETEWMEWDAPWVHAQKKTAAQVRRKVRGRLRGPLPKKRRRMEICCADGLHVGWVNSYPLPEDPAMTALGIDIAEPAYRGRGLGTRAFKLWAAYQFGVTGHDELYCGTWSGNARMIRVAEKCGFEQLRRDSNARRVRGTSYDALTFVLRRECLLRENPALRHVH
jgi:RimJ/RimL family protein N-acetyltransferase